MPSILVTNAEGLNQLQCAKRVLACVGREFVVHHMSNLTKRQWLRASPGVTSHSLPTIMALSEHSSDRSAVDGPGPDMMALPELTFQPETIKRAFPMVPRARGDAWTQEWR